MENPKNLFFNNAFFDFTVASADDIAIVWMQNEVNQRPAYCLDSFISTEMVRVYEGRFTEFQVRDANGDDVLPYRLQCHTLDLCPSFFGRGWNLFHNGQCVLPLTKAAWAELGFGPQSIQHLN